MTRERPKHPNPATDPKRQNEQSEHEGVPHDPSEFKKGDPDGGSEKLPDH